MKKIIYIIAVFFFLNGYGQTYEIPDLTFPTLVGAGKNTTGGDESANIVEVRNLSDSDTYSLRAALEAPGDAIIDFSKLTGAGNIVLQSTISLGSGNKTIAGETAPGDGICLVSTGVEATSFNGNMISNQESNVIFRFLRFRRLGEEVGSNSGLTGILGSASGTVSNFVFDHCSFSWGSDDLFGGVYNGGENITVSHCMFYETVEKTVYSTSAAKGVLMYAGAKNITFFANVFAHLPTRTPSFKVYNEISDNNDLVNNIIYNRQLTGMVLGSVAGGPDTSLPAEGTQYVNVVGNKFISGASTSASRYDIAITSNPAGSDLKYYVEDNITMQRPNGALPEWDVMGEDPNAVVSAGNASTSFQSIIKFPTDFDYSKAVSSDDVQTFTLANAGANIGRDAADARIVNEITAGTGDLIGGPAPIGRSYPTLTGSAWTLKSGTHIPESWANSHGITSDGQIKSSYTFGSKTFLNPHGKTAYQVWRFDRAGDLERIEVPEGVTVPATPPSELLRKRNSVFGTIN